MLKVSIDETVDLAVHNGAVAFPRGGRGTTFGGG